MNPAAIIGIIAGTLGAIHAAIQIVVSLANVSSPYVGLREKMKNLHTKARMLGAHADDVQSELHRQETAGRQRKRQVKAWLENVRQTINEVNSLQEIVGDEVILDPVKRGNLVNTVNRLQQEVEELNRWTLPQDLTL